MMQVNISLQFKLRVGDIALKSRYFKNVCDLMIFKMIYKKIGNNVLLIAAGRQSLKLSTLFYLTEQP